jgi:hypothetical protein
LESVKGNLLSNNIKANPDKTKAIMTMMEPSTKKELQKLIGRIAALSKFISKSAEHSLPFFKALRGEEWGYSSRRLSDSSKTIWQLG